MKLGDENVEAGVDGNQSVPEIQNQSVTYYNQSSSFDTSNRASLANYLFNSPKIIIYANFDFWIK